MKSNIHIILVLYVGASPLVAFGQSGRVQNPPSLGAAASFALFTANGAVGNTDDATSVCSNCVTMIIGDVGTPVGSISLYGPSNSEIVGTTYTADDMTAQATRDLMAAYTTLGNTPITQMVPTTVRAKGTLYPGSYHLTGAASNIPDVLTLDGQGDPNAVFIFLSDAKITTAVNSQVLLTKGTKANNVFWRTQDAVNFGAHTAFAGIILANGAIALGDRTSPEEKALSIGGAISTLSNTVSTTPSVALPVELATFTARNGGSSVELQWTASEKNSAYFVVEMSRTGTSFLPLGQVAGQGTTSQPHAYTWTNSKLGQPRSLPAYFRLRQVDYDGTTTCSPVRMVSAATARQFILEAYPNPARQQFDVLITPPPRTERPPDD